MSSALGEIGESESVEPRLPAVSLPRAPRAVLLWSRGLTAATVLVTLFTLDVITVVFADFWLFESLGLSSVFWTVMPWHKSEFKQLPDEEAVRQVLLAGGVTSGQWRIPFCRSMEEAKSPAFGQKLLSGPVGIFQLQEPGPKETAGGVSSSGRRRLEVFWKKASNQSASRCR